MNKELLDIFYQSVEILKQDPRILGAWQFGSVSKNSSDDYSDVDPVFLVKQEYFEQVDRELPELFKKICPRIHLWWPESYNGSAIKNYALLLEGKEGELHQYDLTIVRESGLDSGMAYIFSKDCREEHIIFDKDGIVKNTVVKRNLDRESHSVPGILNGANIRYQIEMYWLFAFIAVKYFKRENIFKLIYARDTMRSVHLSILKMLIGKGDWSWWAESMTTNLDAEKQTEMLSYFGAPTVDGLKRDFKKALSVFSKDAGELCKQEGLTYPKELEETLLRYIDIQI